MCRKRYCGGDGDDRVDGRCGEQEGEGCRLGDPFVDQPGRDGNCAAFTAWQRRPRHSGDRYSQRCPFRQHSAESFGRHERGDHPADDDAEYQERHCLQGDGAKDGGPLEQLR